MATWAAPGLAGLLEGCFKLCRQQLIGLLPALVGLLFMPLIIATLADFQHRAQYSHWMVLALLVNELILHFWFGDLLAMAMVLLLEKYPYG
jgi:hypothetical protein